jgi:hypothetical protein
MYEAELCTSRTKFGESLLLFTSLSFVLYGHEIWFLTLRENYGLRVCQNRVVRKIFGPKREEVVGGSRKVPDEELNKFYASPNIVRISRSWRLRWMGHILCMGEIRSAYRILFGKPEGKRPLRRPRYRCRAMLEWNLGKAVDWIHLALDRCQWWALVNTIIGLSIS